MVPWEGAETPVSLYRADSIFHETEYAAAEILSLVRTGRYRFRDIAVTARDLDSYSAAIENVFERYGAAAATFWRSRCSAFWPGPWTRSAAAMSTRTCSAI